MNWYYVDAGAQAGPVDEAQLQQLVLNGKIQPNTLVWHEGMPAWTPYSQAVPSAPMAADPNLPPVVGGPSPDGSGGSVCGECGQVFAPTEVIRVADKWVCAGCKPVVLQRLREGVVWSSPVPGGATQADLLARDYTVDIGASFSRGWENFKSNPGLIIGATVLVYLVLMVCNIVPYLGAVVGLILNGPLMGGLWLFYLKSVRNQPASVGDAFGGFGPRFWQFTLTQLIPTVIIFGMVVLIAIPAALMIPMLVRGNPGGMNNPSGAMIGVFVALGVLVLAMMLVMAYLNVCWLFSLALVGDKGLKFWPAMELSRRVVKKHWWGTFGLIMVAALFGMLGVLGCLVGALVTGPVAFGMLASHYDKVFGDLAPERT